MAVRIIFVDPQGREVEASGEPGDSLLRVGQEAGLPLEGTSEGQMACSTCHVLARPDWFATLPRSSDARGI